MEAVKTIKKTIKMAKTIKRIFVVGIIIYSVVSIIITFLYLLEKLGIVNLDSNSNSANSSISSTITDPDVKEVMSMSDEEVWKGLTGGLLTGIPSDKSPSNASEIESAVRNQIVDITVPTWAWENPSDSSNMKKTTKNVTLEVNQLLAKFWTAFFQELYETDKNFVIASVGCFRIDGTGYGQIGFRSAHTYGAAIDINPYDEGNPYGEEHVYTKQEWKALPENHLKYQIIYMDSPLAQLAHKYTLKWGGEWQGSTKDIMHFSFICDGSTRSERLQQYGN